MKLKLKKNQIVLLILGFGFLMLLGGVPRLSILPGAEGLNAGFEGVTIQGQYYKLGSALPSGYSWFTASPYSAVLGADLDIWDTYGRVKTETRQPWIITDPFTEGKKVDYWVKVGDEEFVHVTGEIIVYDLPVDVIALDALTSHVFTGEQFWYSLNAIVWNRALQEQSPVGDHGSTYGHAWETYLAAIIQPTSTLEDKGNHYLLDPMPEAGRQFVLYTSPQEQGTISDLTQGNINATFAGDLSPDSRLVQSAFLRITLTDFGGTTTVLHTYNPTANYHIKVYALRIGKFTYTNPDSTPWANPEPPSNPWDDYWEGFFNMLHSQFGWLFGDSLIAGLPNWILVIVAIVIFFVVLK